MQLLKLFVVVFVLLAFLGSSVVSRKNRRTIKSKLHLDLGNGTIATINVMKKNNVYIFKTRGNSMAKWGLPKTTLVIDYSRNNQLMVLASGKKKYSTCFYMDTNVSKSDFEHVFNGRENYYTTYNGTLSLDGRGEALNRSESRRWFRKIPSVRWLCRKSNIIELTPLDPDADLSSSVNTTFLGINGYLKIAMNTSSVYKYGKYYKKKYNKRKEKKGKGKKPGKLEYIADKLKKALDKAGILDQPGSVGDGSGGGGRVIIRGDNTKKKSGKIKGKGGRSKKKRN